MPGTTPQLILWLRDAPDEDLIRAIVEHSAVQAANISMVDRMALGARPVLEVRNLSRQTKAIEAQARAAEQQPKELWKLFRNLPSLAGGLRDERRKLMGSICRPKLKDWRERPAADQRSAVWWVKYYVNGRELPRGMIACRGCR